MLTAKNLERIMELEDKLRTEYQAKLDAMSAELEQSNKDKAELQALADQQKEQIAALSVEATGNKRTEQLNRELNQRCENLSEKASSRKKQIKALQKDLAEERAEIKTLKQFDAAKMKKNLDANKKKLAEKTAANELLQKSLNKTKSEKAEAELKVKELEVRLAELEPAEEAEEEAA